MGKPWKNACILVLFSLTPAHFPVYLFPHPFFPLSNFNTIKFSKDPLLLLLWICRIWRSLKEDNYSHCSVCEGK